MAKKNFRDSPAAAMLRAGRAQDNAPDMAHNEAQEKSQTDDLTDTPQKKYAPDVAQSNAHKRYKINLGIDSKALYDRIYIQAERKGKSVTRYFNDLALSDIAQSDYIENKKVMKGRNKDGKSRYEEND